MRGRVFPGLSSARTRKLAESGSEVIIIMGKDGFKLGWGDVVDTAHVENSALPKMRQPCVVAESIGSLTLGEVNRGAQCAYHDLNNFQRRRLVSDTV